MRTSLDDLIEEIDKLTKIDLPGALDAARRLTKQYAAEVRAWTELAFVHALNDQYDEAVAAMTQAFNVGPAQPALYFTRGRYELDRGNLESACADFAAGIALCREQQNTYYLESLHFFRADALVRLGRFDEARADLAHVEEGFKTWTTRLITKTELLAACDGEEWNWEKVAVEGSLEQRLEAIDMGAVENAPKAIEFAQRLTQEYPNDAAVRQYLAYTHSMNKDHAAAIQVMNEVVALEPDEPYWYHYRAYERSLLGEFKAALNDLDEAAKRCDREKRGSLWTKIHFWRADMLLRLGQKTEARAALENVPHPYGLRTIEVRSTTDMLAESES